MRRPSRPSRIGTTGSRWGTGSEAWSRLLPRVRAPVAPLELLVFLLEEVQVIPLRQWRLEDLDCQGLLPTLHRPVGQADIGLVILSRKNSCQPSPSDVAHTLGFLEVTT